MVFASFESMDLSASESFPFGAGGEDLPSPLEKKKKKKKAV